MAAKKLGLALGSGAARGWAHIGVLRGLEEIGVRPDVIAGCSVGALVGGAYLLGALDAFESWARTLKPLSALQRFNLKLVRGGFIDTAPAFDAFREYDRPIEDLPLRFAAVAADLGAGEEVVITDGSVIDAARASSAIPVVFHAVPRKNRWLVDGALANPAPISAAASPMLSVIMYSDSSSGEINPRSSRTSRMNFSNRVSSTTPVSGSSLVVPSRMLKISIAAAMPP